MKTAYWASVPLIFITFVRVMDLSSLDDWQDLLTCLAILIGGAWALWRFVLMREGHAKIQFDVEIVFHGESGNQILVEVVAIIHNKGTVRQRIRDIGFKLYVLKKGELFIQGDKKIGHNIRFTKLGERRSWIAPNYDHIFIDSGVTQKCTCTAVLPSDAAFVQVLGSFVYPGNTGETHGAQIVRPVVLPEVQFLSGGPETTSRD